MSLDVYTRFVLALVAILVLLGLLAWLGRRFGLAGRPASGGKRRLAVVESGIIDPIEPPAFARLVDGAPS